MADAIETTYGSCIRFEMVFTDETGAAEDISDDVFGILSSSSIAFHEAVFTKSDPVGGKVEFFMSEEAAKKLSKGKTNWFRLQRTLFGGCEDNSEPIWVTVR